ncbi:helix-turn-helix domain-containing protein [Deinococcus sp. QL22]|uniref:helix-turn-helix domain-containing protein n=1 Tax=Deinococcus sp. QL22 TaxID=2939437 RepID=UPI002016DF2C|nr:helix-turn-helix domain-containing protein [Deinococcus sp. QL22]UQN10233.1 helix-turn-helix domain-containing protein [Deinococcus sp. QL22]
MRRASAIRRREETMANLIGPRLRRARQFHTPPLTMEATAQRATASGYAITENMLNKIETQRRSVYDFEVYALALAVGVDARYLLGLTDDPGFPQAPEPQDEDHR